MQSKSKSRLFVTALAAAMTVGGGVLTQVYAEGNASSAEVQRGVPGVDMDLNASRSQGLDVDAQAGNRNDSDNGIAGTEPDTRTLGAGADTGSTDSGSDMRSPIQDRN